MSNPDPSFVRAHLLSVQDRICEALESEDATARFREQRFDGPDGTLARPCVLENGALIEKAAANFTHSIGTALPAAASARRPELAGAPFEAVSLSLIVHPRNPFVPTSHANFRCFVARPEAREPVWWFGGGFDLTPYYGFVEDCVHWHRVSRDACAPFGDELHPRLKAACDEYFFLKHRSEPRGIGGIFFDDFVLGGFAHSFDFVRSASDAYLDAYLPIVRRRREHPWGERERAWQSLRRGRYVEFNLLYDRGTLYGLQSGRRIESVLASMPPLVQWRYDWRPEPGSVESRFVDDFLRPRDWLAPRVPGHIK